MAANAIPTDFPGASAASIWGFEVPSPFAARSAVRRARRSGLVRIAETSTPRARNPAIALTVFSTPRGVRSRSASGGHPGSSRSCAMPLTQEVEQHRRNLAAHRRRAIRGCRRLTIDDRKCLPTIGTGDDAVALAAVGSENPNQTQFDDLFVVLFEADGRVAWAAQDGGAIWDGGHLVAGAPDGSGVVLGTFAGEVVYGDGEAGATTMISDGARGSFLAAYKPDGSLRWARPVPGGDLTVSTGAIAPLAGGGVALAARFEGTLGVFPGEPAESTFASAGLRDLFVARLGR